MLAWMQAAYGLTSDDAVLQKTPFGFDVSVWEFFWPLMVGARLVVSAPGAHRDPARLVAAIEEQGITTLHFVPSMLSAFVEHLTSEPSAVDRLRLGASCDLQRRGAVVRSFGIRCCGCCRMLHWRTCTARRKRRST